MPQQKIPLPIVAKSERAIPMYATSGSAGADVIAWIEEPICLMPQERVLVPTGICVQIPAGFEIQVRPRSGLAYKNGITVLNSPGTIDSDYTGEIKLILINHSNLPFTIEPHMRIGQLVLTRVYQAEFIPAQELLATERADGGFGHTGVICC